MPVDKLDVRETDPSSIAMNIDFRKVVCCSECGATKFTLIRVRDEQGKKTKPAKYICTKCDGKI